MKRTTWLCLGVAVCCLAASGCRPRHPDEARAKPKKNTPAKKETVEKKAAPPAESKGVVASWVESGWGETEKDAEGHAVENAREKVIVHLKSLLPPLKSLQLPPSWKPSAEFIRKNIFKGPAVRDESKDQVIKNEQQNFEKKVPCWTWTATLTSNHVESLRRNVAEHQAQEAVKERSVLARSRMEELATVVGFLTLALAGVWGYVRLDQWTRRTRRSWLRLGIAAIVLGGGVGLYLLTFKSSSSSLESPPAASPAKGR